MFCTWYLTEMHVKTARREFRPGKTWPPGPSSFTGITGSAEALPILCVRYFWWEREREIQTDRDGSDVTIVALKLAMNSHFPLPKIRNWRWAYTFPCQKFAQYRKRFRASYNTDRQRRKWRHHCRAKIGDEFTLSLAKNSQLAMSLHFPLPKIRTSRFSLHTSRLSLHWEVYHCGAENRKIRNWRWAYTFPCQKFALSFLPSHFPSLPSRRGLPLWRWKSQWVHTFHCQNFFRPLCSPLSNGTSRATSDRKSKTNDQILPSPILTFLFVPSKKWIKLIPKTIGNRKRDWAWGCSGW